MSRQVGSSDRNQVVKSLVAGSEGLELSRSAGSEGADKDDFRGGDAVLLHGFDRGGKAVGMDDEYLERIVLVDWRGE